MSEGNGHVAEAVVAKVGTDGDVELQAVEMDPSSGSSTQTDPLEFQLWTPDDTILPPEDLSLLTNLTGLSSIRATCLEALARNTVGLGWDVTVWPDHDGEVTRNDVTEARRKLDALARRDKRLDRPSFSSLMYAVKHDAEECGSGYIEVSRSAKTGQIDGLYHLPGKLMRRKKDRSGYVLGQSASMTQANDFAGTSASFDLATRVDYLNFGEKVIYDDNGVPQRKLAPGAKRWKTNEVIALRVYTSESRDYGLPRDAALAVEYAAAKFVDDYRESFFAASGTPPTIVFVQGEEKRDGSRVRFTVPSSTMRRIDQAVRSDGRPGQRVVFIPVPPGTQTNSIELGKLSDRDITFDGFTTAHKANVGGAFRLSPIFYGDLSQSGGRYTAEVERALTLEQVFDPDQREIEDRLWTTLMVDLGYPALKVTFKRMAVEGDSAKREAAQNGAVIGAITYGEWRKSNGFDPLPWDGQPDDAENPNNKLIPPQQQAGTAPHDPVPTGAADQRGLKPGIGGRTGRDSPLAKHGGVEHVEEVVADLADELSEYGPVAEAE